LAKSIACPIVATGEAIIPAFESLPLGETNTPKTSLTTHGSLVFEGTSEFGRQSPPHG